MMNIGSHFPVISNNSNSSLAGSRSQKVETVSSEARNSFVVPSNQSHFESVFSANDGASFSKVESVDRFTQDALNLYSKNQSLGINSPRDYLVGVDVYA